MVAGRVSNSEIQVPALPAHARCSHEPRASRGLTHHTLSVLVENKAGVLARVVEPVLPARLQHLLAGRRADRRRAFSRITVVVDVESAPLEQIVKQLHKLINVVKITELDPRQSVERELLLATVKAGPPTRGTGGRAGADLRGPHPRASATMQLTVSLEGHPSKVDDFEELLRPFGLVELQRTGRVALPELEREASRLAQRERQGVITDGQRVLREGRRPVADRRPQGGGARLRLAGPRPRAEPEGFGHRRAGRPARRARRPRPRPRPPACGSCRPPRPPRRPTSS